GLMEGRMEGRMAGRHEGESLLLVKQLTCRFGPLPAWVGERLAQASEDELQAWGEALLSAPTLAAVFGDEPR
ncbi:DUF4351 domain-containing protein, partial [Accumulibacter sp.]|uniref:DUF4351 domain-containing protein n=4 Tax=Accumulibacter sp. TaxID=2053492 RepID=UPI002B9189F8